jgi:DNA topoisomerase-1
MYNDMPPKFYKKKNGIQNNKKPSKDFQKDSAVFLVIVESPSKCSKIEEYLGNQYKCIASNGHIRHIMGLKSIDTKTSFDADFSIIDIKQSHINKMRSIISQFEKKNIILASDDDREGEAIAWHICQVFGLDVGTTQRIIFHEITERALIEAVQNPTRINMNTVVAQHARQTLDVIVGYKISPFLWKYINKNGNGGDSSLSAGRCQTPALRLVYDNYLESINSKTETKYKTTASFFSKHLIFDLNKEYDTGEQVVSFLEKSKQFIHNLSIGEKKDSIKPAPKPLHTARLLQVASNVLHLSPKQTMDICQKLYQGGYITYMRTESCQYSKPFLEKAEKYIISEFKTEKMVGDLNKIENKNTNNPHEAIRVTNIQLKYINSDDKRNSSLYHLIWKNTVESCMADAHYHNYSIRITAPENTWYSHILEIPVFYGWKIIDNNKATMDTNESETDIVNGILFYIQTIERTKNPVNFNYIENKVVFRNKHNFYTESTLIHRLEELGIGRPSTFASIVDTIQQRHYVNKQDVQGSLFKCKDFKMIFREPIIETKNERQFGNEKGKLIIQPVGISTIRFLLEYYEPLFSYEYTNKMENDLDELSMKEEPESEKTSLCKNCYNQIKELSKPVNQIAKAIYKIDDSHEFMYNKFGPVIRKSIIENTETKYDYLPIKKDLNIDIEKIKNKEYSLEDLVEYTDSCLGQYDGHSLFIRTGKFGNYIEWGENKQSIKEIKKKIGDIKLEDVIEFMDRKNNPIVDDSSTEKTGILRVLNNTMSIRSGKFGPYVFYKTADMKKPMFLNIKKFKDGFFICEIDTLVKWLCKTYNLPEQ